MLNASVNTAAGCQREAQALRTQAPGHLQVFAHFRPRLAGQRVVVIGHYPGLERLWQDQPYQCLERQQQEGDLPDCAAEYLLPEADWVFVSASSIANKTLPRLLELSRGPGGADGAEPALAGRLAALRRGLRPGFACSTRTACGG